MPFIFTSIAMAVPLQDIDERPPLLAENACAGFLRSALKLAGEIAATAPLALLMPLRRTGVASFVRAAVLGALI